MDEKQIQELEPTGPDSFPGPLDVAGAGKLTLQLSPVLLECPVWSWFLPGSQVAVSVPCCLLRPFCSHCWGAFSVSQTRNETKPDSTQPSRRCQSDPEAWTAEWWAGGPAAASSLTALWGGVGPAQPGSAAARSLHGSNHSSTQPDQGLAEKGVGLCQSSSLEGAS